MFIASRRVLMGARRIWSKTTIRGLSVCGVRINGRLTSEVWGIRL